MNTTDTNPCNPGKDVATDHSSIFNKIAYGAFVALALYFLVFSADKMNGVMNLGIALVFDPFDQQVSWKNRPFYQRAWLITHLIVLFGLFAWGILLP